MLAIVKLWQTDWAINAMFLSFMSSGNKHYSTSQELYIWFVFCWDYDNCQFCPYPSGLLHKHMGQSHCPTVSEVTQNIRDHFVNVPSQWETMLHCNVISHWLGAFTKWSLKITTTNLHIFWDIMSTIVYFSLSNRWQPTLMWWWLAGWLLHSHQACHARLQSGPAQ